MIKKLKPLSYVISICLVLWVALISSSFFISQGAMRISVLAAKIEFGVHILTLIFLILICKKINRDDRKAIIWLLMINIWLFLVDFLFYIAAYANNTYLLQMSFLQFVLYYAPCIVYCIIMITFLSKILLKEVLHVRGFLKVVATLVVINIVTIGLFLSSIHYAFGVISWQTISQMAMLGIELILFDFSILGLIYSNSSSASLLLSGTIILITGDFFLTYSSISQTVTLFSYGELFWLLGLLFIMFSVISIRQNGHYSVSTWFRKSNMIKSRLAVWAVGTSVSGFLFFFVIAYIFSIVNKQVFVGLPLFIMLYSVIAVTLSIFMGKTFEAPFKKIESNIEALKEHNDKAKLDDNFSTEEFIYLQKFIVDAFEFKEEKDRAKKELGEMTAQVAHDIRSPLAALDMLITMVGKKLSEEERTMMRTASRRINNIANDLVAKYKGREHNPEVKMFVYVVMKDIVSEKDLEYGHKNIKFELLLDEPQSAFLLTEGNYKEMRRMLSNLVNNAVNAMPNGGLIQVFCERKGEEVCVRIRDQGCGLSETRITQLLSENQASDAGIGLGLKHTKEYMKKHKGSFKIESDPGRGTEVSLAFPVLEKPKWLVEKIEIDFTKPVMIVDDDTSIHDVWTNKLKDFKVIREDFYTTGEARIALREKDSKPDLVLCDYEFIGQKENGLDFLESIQDIPAKKYLVTTHVDNEEILNRCEALNVQLVPKHLLPYISILAKGQVKTEQKQVETNMIDAIFIDDEPYNHEFWQFMAAGKQKKLECFLSLDEFEKVEQNFSREIPIYIDLNLKGMSGLDVAKKLYDLGFLKLYITSGFINFDVKDHPYLAGVRDKSPPF